MNFVPSHFTMAAHVEGHSWGNSGPGYEVLVGHHLRPIGEVALADCDGNVAVLVQAAKDAAQDYVDGLER